MTSTVAEETGGGSGGRIEILASSVEVTGSAPGFEDGEFVWRSSQIASLSLGDGAGGAIELETGSLEVTDGGQVYSETRAVGDGGASAQAAEYLEG